MTITAADAVNDLYSTKCTCGSRKNARRSFCGPCYARLPIPMARALYKRVGEGYEVAFSEARAFLTGKDAR